MTDNEFLTKLSDGLEDLAKLIKEYAGNTGTDPVTPSEVALHENTPVDTSKVDPDPKSEPVIPKVTLEDVRKVLAAKSKEGKTSMVRDLLKSHEAAKLSEIPTDLFPVLLKEAEAL